MLYHRPKTLIVIINLSPHSLHTIMSSLQVLMSSNKKMCKRAKLSFFIMPPSGHKNMPGYLDILKTQIYGVSG